MDKADIKSHVAQILKSDDRAPLLQGAERELELLMSSDADTVRQSLLEALVMSTEHHVRRNAAWLLRSFAMPPDVDWLVGVLQTDPDARVRQYVTVALGRLGQASAVEGLASAVDDSDVGVRLNAIRAMGMLGEMTVVGLLIQKLKNNKEDDEVQAMAARALGQLEAREALNTLFNSLNRKSISISTESAMALARLGVPALPRLLEALHNDKKHYQRRRRASAHALGWMVGNGFLRNNPFAITAAMEALVAESGSLEPSVREEVAQALGSSNDIRALEPLTIGLLYDVPSVRRSSAKALQEMAAARRVPMSAAVGPLIQATADRDEDVRRHAIAALGHTGHERAIQTLFLLLEDAPPETQYQAILALGNSRSEAVVKPVSRYLRSKDPWMRRCVAVALGQLGNARGLKPLTIALSDVHPDVRQWAAIALGQIGDISVYGALWEHLDDEVERVRHAVAGAIGTLMERRAR